MEGWFVVGKAQKRLLRLDSTSIVCEMCKDKEKEACLLEELGFK